MYEHLNDNDLLSFINAAEAKAIQITERIHALIDEKHDLAMRRAALQSEWGRRHVHQPG